MLYSSIGLLAILILLVENPDILLRRNDAFEVPAWRVYRRFLLAVLAYYLADILWGFLESLKLPLPLFLDTSVYFIAMAAGVLYWTQYVVVYLEEETPFGRFLILAGRAIAAATALLVALNVFVPVLFSVDQAGGYHPTPARYILVFVQLILPLVIVVYASSALVKLPAGSKQGKKYRTLALFSLIMSIFLFLQFLYPYLPFYAVAYMLGTSLLRAFVIGDEKEQYRQALVETGKIRELKQSISALLDNMPALSFSKDAKTGVYLACNQAFAEYAHKASPEGVVGLTDHEIFDSVTASHFVEDDKMALSMDEPYIFFEDVPDAAGNQRQFQTTKLKYIDTSGRLCTLGMCQDVTDMVRIQRENATTKEAYEKARGTGIIFTHIAQALARDYNFLYYVNLKTGAYVEYHTGKDFGLLTEARRGPDFFASCQQEVPTIVHPDDREALLRALNRETLRDELLRNSTYTITYRLLGQDEPVYVNLKASLMEDDEDYIIIGVTNIDSQMKQFFAQEKQKRHSDNMISALSADYHSVFYLNLDRDEAICYRVDGRSRIGVGSGESFPFREQLARYARQYVRKDDQEGFLRFLDPEHIRSELEHETVIAHRYLTCRDGEEHYEQVRIAAFQTPDNRGRKRIQAVGMGFSDVDRETRDAIAKRNALRDALTAAEEANRAKTAFLSNMSHEIRTPMNAIIGLDTLALRDENLPPHTREELEKIGESAKRMLSLINDILDMSRIESGRMELNEDRFSLRELLEQVDIIIGGQCRDKGLSYVCDRQTPVDEWLIGDALKLKQVLINTLGNAVKFTDPPGTVTFTMAQEITAPEQALLRFRMEDTGIGIEQDYLPRLFDAFSQGDTSTSTRYGGSGLGMAITKNIVDKMGGTISVESEPGKGTVFSITVPIRRAESAPGHAVEAREAAPVTLEGRRMLIAEDQEINAEILMDLLEVEDMTSEWAENGQSAVEMFDDSEPGYFDAILMDMRMPVMDGVTATQEIRKLSRPDAKTIPIIALTANAFEEDVQQCLQAGMNAHLSKPVDMELLTETLKKMLAQ